jgi:hypothetical protein
MLIITNPVERTKQYLPSILIKNEVQLNIFDIEKAFMMSLGILTLLWKPMFNSNIFYLEKLVMNRD